MPIDKTDVERFFNDYAEALSSHDANHIARHWGVPALVLGDQGAIAVNKPEEVVAFFAASMEQYADVAKARAGIRSAIALSASSIACEIEWEHLDQGGEVVGSEAGHYILSRDEDAVKIHVYTPKL